MNSTQKQDSFKEMLEMLKGDYSYPVKIWVWGKIVKEWAGIIIGITIFLFIFLFIILSMDWSGSQGKDEMRSQSKASPVQPSEAALPMKDIVAFMALCQRSVRRDRALWDP